MGKGGIELTKREIHEGVEARFLAILGFIESLPTEEDQREATLVAAIFYDEAWGTIERELPNIARGIKASRILMDAA